MKESYADKDKFHALLDAAVCAIISIDEDGVIQAVNKSAQKMFLKSENQLIGSNVNCLMPEPWASAHDGYLWNYKKTGKKKIIGIGREAQGLKSDGSVFPIHLSVSDYEMDGKVFYTGVVHDLTIQKQSELALRHLQKMEAIGQLTGGIAHDFNNLLTVITGNLELLEMRIKDESQLGLLKEAQEAAYLGADLTARLLAFARKSALTPELINLNELIKSIHPMLERTLGEKIDIQTSMEVDLWDTIVDAGQVESVILNLAVNARDAMPAGGQVMLETKNIEINSDYAEMEFGLNAGEYVCLTVSDTGEGMSEKIKQQAFEPFFTTKEPGKGTGLGLSMVYGFAKQSGGHITIYSEQGLGTTLNLYLPKATQKIESSETISLSDSDLVRGKGQTVLVVEDDIRVQTISVQRLENLNYKVITASNGDEALAILSGNSNIDLVFTDLVMPGQISGYDLTEIINKDYPHIAMLMTSGFAEDVIHGARLAQYKVNLLRKPYKQSDLAKYIHNALRQKN